MNHIQILVRRSTAFLWAGPVSLLLAASLSAQSNPGDVLYELKISETTGGFAGTLGDGDDFGGAVDSLGDLDDDGVKDLVVGATQEQAAPVGAGKVWILFMNADGTVDSEVPISGLPGMDSGDSFGASVTGLGDLDGDGVEDLAVGAPGDEGTGALWIFFLDTDGSIKSQQKIFEGSSGFTGDLDSSDFFGRSVERLPDIDGNGVTDLAVGAMLDDDGGDGRGAVWILLLQHAGQQVSVLGQEKISSTVGSVSGLDNGDQFGSDVASMGDFDGGGANILALAIGARLDDGPSNTATSEGAVYIVFIDSSFVVTSQTKLDGEDAGDFFGESVARLGDVDGNGVEDLIIGAPFDDVASQSGAVFVLRLSLSGTTVGVLGQTKINEGFGNFQGDLDAVDAFGYDVAGIGDVDGDGRPDALVGAIWDDDGGSANGAVWELFLNDGTLDLGTTTTWLGPASNPHWDKTNNWSNGQPDSTKTAIIPGNGPLFPQLRNTTQSCKHLWIRPGASIEFVSVSSVLEVHDGATLLGPITGPGSKEVRFVGSGVLSGTSTISEPVTFNADMTIQGGPLTLSSSLTKTGSTAVTVAAGAELVVQGSTTLTGGGVLSDGGTLDLNGATTLAMSSTSPPTLRLAGNLTVNSSLFAPTSGLVVFDGSAAQTVSLSGGTQAEFFDLSIQNSSLAGVTFTTEGHVSNDMELDGPCQTPGFDVDGSLTGSIQGAMSGTGGNCELKVGRDFNFGGFLEMCQVTLYNPTGEFIVVDATNPLPGRLVIDVGGVVLVESTLTLEDGLEILAGRFDVQGNELVLTGESSVLVEDTLAVGPGGRIRLETNTMSVASGGTLSLVGAPSAFARISGTNGGGYGLVLEEGATLEARNFAFEEMGAAGIVIDRNALIASAPADLRNGLFDKPAPGGKLLSIERASPATFRYLQFANTGSSGLKNVFVPATSAPISLVNWSGAFAGPAFEDDAAGKLTWGPNEETLLSSFLARRWVPKQVSLSWETTVEVDCTSFLLERALEPVGPWVTVVELQASGPSTYVVNDSSALPATAYTYRLSERLTHGPLRILAHRSIPAGAKSGQKPPPSSLPLLTGHVGGGKDFGSIQEATATLLPEPGGVATLVLEPGSYAAFDLPVDPREPKSWRLVARVPGSVVIDASRGPVTLRDLPAGASVELAGLVLTSGNADQPALAIRDCAGTVLLDGLTVRGAVEIENGGALLIQDSELRGLRLERGSRVEVSGGTLGQVELAGRSWLESFDLACSPEIEAGSRWLAHAGRRPELALVQRASSQSAPRLSAALHAAPGSIWWLLSAEELGTLGKIVPGARAPLSRPLGAPRQIGALGLDEIELPSVIDLAGLDSSHYFRGFVVDAYRHEYVLTEVERLP